MKNEIHFPWGSKIERGRVTAKTEGEAGSEYTVESADRPGVTGWGLRSMDPECEEGDRVYFFLFGDGKGMILSRM